MKKIVSILMALALMTTALMLASCDGTPADTGTGAAASDNTAGTGTEEVNTITVPEVTIHYVTADVYADKATAEANGLKAADNASLSGWFKETVEFDENFEIKIPEDFSNVDSYVLRIAQGQYIEEVDVFKVADRSGIDAVKTMVEYRCNKQKNNNDFKLYDDENGTNAKMIDTGKVVVIGNFVVYAVTENTDVSILRAQKFLQDNPNCSVIDLYNSVAKEVSITNGSGKEETKSTDNEKPVTSNSEETVTEAAETEITAETEANTSDTSIPADYPEATASSYFDFGHGSDHYEIISGHGATAKVSMPSTVVIPYKYEKLPVTKIRGSAFFGYNIKNLVIAGSVTEIESSAFCGCESLESVIIYNGLEIIGPKAFSSCSRLESITLPNTVKRIEAQAFSMCKSLKTINFNGTVAQWNAISKSDLTGIVAWNAGTGNYTVNCTDGSINK